jgi:predicted outer membrane repeat protein
MRAMLGRTAMAVLTSAGMAVAGTAWPAGATTRPGVVDVPCGAAALSAAVGTASAGEVLNLDRSCAYLLAAGLPAISVNLSIRGNGAVIEPAPGSSGFSLLTNDSSGLDLIDLSFSNADAGSSGGGGAIENDGDLTVTGGSFTGNATGGFGGAIDNSGTLTVTGAAFDANQAEDGGAVENLAAATITGSTFRANQAGFNGGAIHNEGQLIVTGSRFSANSATNNGGGLFNGADGYAATITRAFFRGSQAGDGAGIYNEDVVSLTGVRLSRGTASGQGGGVYTDWVLSATNSRITHNTAAAGGGGIYNGDSFGPPGTVTLTNSKVAHNQPDDCEPVNTIAGCGDPPAKARLAHAGRGRPARAHGRTGVPASDFYPQSGG